MENIKGLGQELITVEDNGLVGELTDVSVAFTSLDMENATKEDKIMMFNAINGQGSKRIKELVNTVIPVANVYVEEIRIKDDKGVESVCPRIILLDDENNGYCAVSMGVFGSLKKIFQMFGLPNTWDEPLKITPKIISKGTKQITTLEVVL